MQLILAHRTLDFDALAAMVAAKKLYPRAKLVVSGKPDPTVREFMALYKDAIPFLRSHQVPVQELEKVIIVDTNAVKQLGDMSWTIEKAGEIHIYDHHPETGEIQATHSRIERLGAVTTMLVEELVRKNIAISPYEATIYALGIYQDTGCLTYPGTTPRDARMAALLLEKGANLKVVGDFIERGLNDDQQELFNDLITNAEELWVNGIQVLVSKARVDNYVGGLAFLTSKLLEITGVDSVIAVVKMEKKVHLVGRTRVDCVPMHRVMANFGGGGHPKAAAATVKDMDLEGVYQKLRDLLKKFVQPVLTAEKIMSYPVKAVAPDTSIAEAGKLMLRYGHSGMPVRDQEKLVGIISRRDVDKALYHGLGHAPVKGFMSRNVRVISPDTPLPEIQRLMVQYDIGRLPVVENDRMVGIVSRSDVLRTLHGEGYNHPFNTLYLNQCNIREKPDVRRLLAQQLTGEQLELLAGIGRLADEHNWGTYLVGGVVRDLLLEVPNFDFDIVVEGNAPQLAQAVAEEYDGRLVVHEKFQTATVVLNDGLKVDFATARKEFYEYPAALPTVEASTLKEDLYRRDFTINAMAVQLNEDNFGELVDFFCGYTDLEEKCIRVLHNLSFIEDPTRILRAVRFEQRYCFEIEPQTAYVMRNAILEETLKSVSADRVWAELKLILEEAAPIRIFKRLAELEVWSQIIPGLEWNDTLEGNLERVEKIADTISREAGSKLDTWLIYLTLILKAAGKRHATGWLQQLSLAKEYRQFIASCLDHDLVQLSGRLKELTLKELHKILRARSTGEVAVLLCQLDDSGLREWILKYLVKRRSIKEEITVDGNYLRALGVKPGPVYGKVLFALECAVLNDEVAGEAAQREFVHRWLKEKGVL